MKNFRPCLSTIQAAPFRQLTANFPNESTEWLWNSYGIVGVPSLSVNVPSWSDSDWVLVVAKV